MNTTNESSLDENTVYVENIVLANNSSIFIENNQATQDDNTRMKLHEDDAIMCNDLIRCNMIY